MRAMAKKVGDVRSKGRVFADSGLVKDHLAHFISQTIEKLDLNQGEAATMMGITRRDLSKLLRGDLDKLSLERLLALVRALGSDVEIKIRPGKVKRTARPRKLQTMADRINYLRKLSGLTQYALADQADVTRGAVSTWGRGYNISDENLAKLADVFGVSPEWIRDGEGETPTDVRRL